MIILLWRECKVKRTRNKKTACPCRTTIISGGWVREALVPVPRVIKRLNYRICKKSLMITASFKLVSVTVTSTSIMFFTIYLRVPHSVHSIIFCLNPLLLISNGHIIQVKLRVDAYQRSILVVFGPNDAKTKCNKEGKENKLLGHLEPNTYRLE